MHVRLNNDKQSYSASYVQHMGRKLSDAQIDKVIIFWQQQAFFNIDAIIFKKNLKDFISQNKNNQFMLSVNYGAQGVLKQLVYGGEKEFTFDDEKRVLRFVKAKRPSAMLFDRLFSLGWIHEHISMEMNTNGKIVYSIGYKAPFENFDTWKSDAILAECLLSAVMPAKARHMTNT